MQPKMLISSWQALLLVVFANVSTTVLFIPSQPAAIVFQDAWIPILLASILTTLLLFYPLAYLGKKYPGKTIIQYCDEILGKYFGKACSLFLLSQFFLIHCWTLREFGDFVALLFPDTPIVVIITFFSVFTIYAVYNGIEVIGRCAEFIFPLGVLSLIFIGISNMMHIEITNILPVMESDIHSILLATIAPVDWLTTGFVFGVITSFVNKTNNLVKIALIAGVISGLVIITFSVLNILVLGVPVLNITTYPLLSLAKMSKLPLLERMEIIVIMFWTTWVFMRVVLFSYASVLSLSQVFNLKDYRYFIIPETVLAIAYSHFQYESIVEMFYVFGMAHFYYLIPQLFLPFTLWVVALIRGKLSMRKNMSSLRS